MDFKIRIFIIAFIMCFISQKTEAQYKLQTHFDIGKTNTSNGMFVTNSSFFDYTRKKTNFKIGTKFDIYNQNSYQNFFSGVDLEITQKFPLKKIELFMTGQYFVNFFSQIINEHNVALLGGLKSKHIEFLTGVHCRTIFLPRGAIDMNGLIENRLIFELWNLVYNFKYHVKPIDSKWNIGLGITNMDYFVINQASNPMFNLFGNYKINPKFSVFAECWLLKAGIMNISANYYGSFLKTGLIWKIK